MNDRIETPATRHLSANIERIAKAFGVVAVRVDGADQRFLGDDEWRSFTRFSLEAFDQTREPRMKTISGKHSIFIHQHGPESIAVVIVTGHALAKCIHRIIRKMAAKS